MRPACLRPLRLLMAQLSAKALMNQRKVKRCSASSHTNAPVNRLFANYTLSTLFFEKKCVLAWKRVRHVHASPHTPIPGHGSETNFWSTTSFRVDFLVLGKLTWEGDFWLDDAVAGFLVLTRIAFEVGLTTRDFTTGAFTNPSLEGALMSEKSRRVWAFVWERFVWPRAGIFLAGNRAKGWTSTFGRCRSFSASRRKARTSSEPAASCRQASRWCVLKVLWRSQRTSRTVDLTPTKAVAKGQRTMEESFWASFKSPANCSKLRSKGLSRKVTTPYQNALSTCYPCIEEKVL